MGQCLSSRTRELSLKPEESPISRRDGFVDLGFGERYARPPQHRNTPAPVDYGREESRLKELFSALRTGLVFTTTEFSVLPGITTTAKVRFSVGSRELQRLQEQASVEEESSHADTDDHEEERSEVDDPQSDGVFELRVSLYGSAWAQGLSLQITMWPVVGPFGGRKLVFIWSENILRVQGCEKGEVNARASPGSFETETEFCKCCLLLAYQNDLTGNLYFEEMSEDEVQNPVNPDTEVLPLSKIAYRVAVSNLNAIPNSVTIPAKIYHLLYGSHPPVKISIRMWPNTYANQLGAASEMKVKSGVVFSEFVFLVREHFQIPPNTTLKFYHNYKRVQLNEQVTSKYNKLDCFVISYSDSIHGSYNSGMDEVESDSTLVVSLVGYDVQNIQASTEMRLKDFDMLLRRKFKLQKDSFLVILAEDDSAPQYTSCNNWKCIYPFSLPDSSFSAGFRRSIRRMSSRRRRSSNASSHGGRQLPRDHDSVLAPQAEKVVEMLSTSSRHFPCNSDQFGLSMEELYQSMPMYQMSLEQYGVHQYAIIQAFEVTGPSIPITFRVLSDHSHNPSDLARQGVPRTRLANIMDINPNWSIHTFLQYVDAIISPASVVRKKRLLLKDHSIDDSEDLSTLTLGELLDYWKPTWWPVKNVKRKQLTLKDIDPAEFLLVDKY